MSGMLILIVTTALSLATILTVIIYQTTRRRTRQLHDLHQRMQQLERRELAANNAAQDMSNRNPEAKAHPSPGR